MQLFKQLPRQGALPAIAIVLSTQSQALVMFIGIPIKPKFTYRRRSTAMPSSLLPVQCLQVISINIVVPQAGVSR